ncbi:hypothetical protein P7C70_g891, partial [Phenoliferia sp. Uapishka_3]
MEPPRASGVSSHAEGRVTPGSTDLPILQGREGAGTHKAHQEANVPEPLRSFHFGQGWTNAERKALQAAMDVVDPQANSYRTETQYWEAVAQRVPHRTPGACRSQWKSLELSCKTQINDGAEWTAEEEQLLVTLKTPIQGQRRLTGRQIADRIGTGRSLSVYSKKWADLKMGCNCITIDDTDDEGDSRSEDDVEAQPFEESSSSPVQTQAKTARTDAAPPPAPQPIISGSTPAQIYETPSDIEVEIALRERFGDRAVLGLSETEITNLKASINTYHLKRLTKTQKNELRG